jgi:hypothetical protein
MVLQRVYKRLDQFAQKVVWGSIPSRTKHSASFLLHRGVSLTIKVCCEGWHELKTNKDHGGFGPMVAANLSP